MSEPHSYDVFISYARADRAWARESLLPRAGAAPWQSEKRCSAPSTVTSLNNLAWLYYDEGDIAEAAPLMRRTLDIRERVLGPQHPNTMTSRENLVAIEEQLVREQGDAEGQ